jgi:hypothetical protein
MARAKRTTAAREMELAVRSMCDVRSRFQSVLQLMKYQRDDLDAETIEAAYPVYPAIEEAYGAMLALEKRLNDEAAREAAEKAKRQRWQIVARDDRNPQRGYLPVSRTYLSQKVAMRRAEAMTERAQLTKQDFTYSVVAA